jgi:hypothetical protein
MSGYLAGTYIVFDTVTLLNGGHFAAFITKYDAGGNVLWARAGWTQPSAFGPTTTEMSGVVADSSGNLYGTGSFESSTLTLGSHVLHNKGDFDLFLVKYDPDGNVLWAKSAGGTRSDFSVSVARDRSGNILTAGYYSSPVLILGTDTLKCPEPSSSNTLLVKYDTTGKILWARSGGTTGIQRGEAVATDTSGNVYMTGVFESPTIIFGSDTLTNASDEFDIFLVKYDAGGNVLWARSAGSTSWDNATSVAVDASGNPYVTGSFESSRLIIGADTLYNPGVTSIFLAKYDYNGNVLWAKSAGFSLNDAAASVAADRSGNVFITGSFSSPKLIFGADTLINTNYDIMYGYCDMFLAKAGSNTGFAELRNSPGISVFPNPATDKIIIETSATPVNSQLSIINLNAQELITQKISERKTVIRISNLPNGIYFIRLTNDQSVDIGKFIKQ